MATAHTVLSTRRREKDTTPRLFSCKSERSIVGEGGAVKSFKMTAFLPERARRFCDGSFTTSSSLATFLGTSFEGLVAPALILSYINDATTKAQLDPWPMHGKGYRSLMQRWHGAAMAVEGGLRGWTGPHDILFPSKAFLDCDW